MKSVPVEICLSFAEPLFQVDHLYTKNQTILYNMLEWPQQPYSKLIVIAIANTLDLPETMFKKKLQSRLVSSADGERRSV